MSLSPLFGAGLVVRRLRISASEEVFLKGVLEASEGVAALFSVQAGELAAVAPASRARALDELLRDMQSEVPSLGIL